MQEKTFSSLESYAQTLIKCSSRVVNSQEKSLQTEAKTLLTHSKQILSKFQYVQK